MIAAGTVGPQQITTSISTSKKILDVNMFRTGLTITNGSLQSLLVSFGAPCTATLFTKSVAPNTAWDVPDYQVVSDVYVFSTLGLLAINACSYTEFVTMQG